MAGGRRELRGANGAAHQGYAMAALLVGMNVLAVLLSVGLPVWQTALRREREAELVFRGEQYVQAIRLFQRRYAGTFPPSVDLLVEQRFLRRRYKDPITNGEFRILYAGPGPAAVEASATHAEPGGPQAPRPAVARGAHAAVGARGRGVIGVVSTSARPALRLYNGRGRYDEWAFVATSIQRTAAVPAPAVPPGRKEGRRAIEAPTLPLRRGGMPR